MNELDELDKKLLNVLQTNDVFTPNIRQIAAMLGVAPSTVHFRIQRLTKTGVLSAPHSTVMGEKVGLGLTMICLLRALPGGGKEQATYHEMIPKKIAQIPQVQEVHTLQGEWDVFVKLKVKDSAEYLGILRKQILALDGIKQVVGFVSAESLKDTETILLS